MCMYLKCILIYICVFINLTQQCTNTGYPFENFLGTITPYRIVSNKSFDRIEYKGCSPRKIWMLVRHGTRNPSSKSIERMKNRLPDLKSYILKNEGLPNGMRIQFIKNRDLDLLYKWKLSVDAKEEKMLTHEGEEEMLLLAERMQSRFPDVLSPIYSNTSYKFKYTYSQRTKKSAYYFVAGLFGKKTVKDVWFPKPLKKDPILRFYKLCDKWDKDVKNNPKTADKRLAFEKSSYMKNALEKISQRLDLKGVLTSDDLVVMYSACAFETAWNRKSKSPWCSPFTVDDLKVLEYAEDLKYYWQDGYGHELTYKQACPALKDMVNFITSKDAHSKVSVYFTHSGTILKVLAHLGLYKETEHLTAQNYLKMDKRKWRTSLIDSFASNLAFVLYNCGDKNKILTMHQENIVRLPSCPTTDLCDIETIHKFYNQSLNGCDFDAMCSD